MSFTIYGFIVTSADQARSVMLVAKLNGNSQVVRQCMAIIEKFER